MILPQISHFYKCRNFSSIFATFLDQLLHPYKFYGRECQEYSFIFASCEPLILVETLYFRLVDFLNIKEMFDVVLISQIKCMVSKESRPSFDASYLKKDLIRN